MPDDATPQSEAQIPTNLRLLLILEAVARRGVAVKPSELVTEIGLPKPTLHRLLQTAESEGFLQRDLDGRSFAPGPRLRNLSVTTLSSEHIRTARLFVMKAAAEEIGETCNLAIADREGMTYLDRVETEWPLRIQLPIGTRVPFHCTASGKMYLSTLRRQTLETVLTARPLDQLTDHSFTDPELLKEELLLTRERGYSTDDEEFMVGMTAIAVPVLDSNKRLMATLSVHAPNQRHTVESLKGFLDVMKKASKQLSALNAI